MDASVWTLIGLGWWSFSSAVHWGSAAIARHRRPAPIARHRAGDFSIVAPLNGAADASPAYVAALAELSRAGAEILLCVADPGDGAVEPANCQWRAALGGGPPLPDRPVLVTFDDGYRTVATVAMTTRISCPVPGFA